MSKFMLPCRDLLHRVESALPEPAKTCRVQPGLSHPPCPTGTNRVCLVKHSLVPCYWPSPDCLVRSELSLSDPTRTQPRPAKSASTSPIVIRRTCRTTTEHAPPRLPQQAGTEPPGRIEACYTQRAMTARKCSGIPRHNITGNTEPYVP